jgi:hypothetical protein
MARGFSPGTVAARLSRAQWLGHDAIVGVTLAGARMLKTLQAELQTAGIRLRLVAVHASVRDILRAEGLEERVGLLWPQDLGGRIPSTSFTPRCER